MAENSTLHRYASELVGTLVLVAVIVFVLALFVGGRVHEWLNPGLNVRVVMPAVGLFGPNQDYTAFSSGMNQTARLQSLAGFREILVMEAAKRALPSRKDLRFEKAKSVKVKNVGRPLRYFKLKN